MAYNFDKIAARYDRMNRLMTLGLDCRWRRRAVEGLGGEVLDVACGTGDMSEALLRQGCRVTGVDLSEEMLSIARAKVPSVAFLRADAEQLPFPDAAFDAVTCAFGVRNFVHLEAGLAEMLRVLKPGGRLAVLELATPDSPLVRPLYHLYARRVIPPLGRLLAGNREAYAYLPASIERFPKGDAFLAILEKAGFGIRNPRQREFTFGVCRLYTATRL
ncbi:MAG: bifunctional demethylmenaquinone methyltransferase/2-methoxy-6-polyprenyl-1,4-benzoquinol methylase UbiE [Bacteroidales bacterium]|nr:bifunctional demethylmenaquinone methyltransferase/2-methoxy-6-polyprenyl-1,4-benzoquinol methylase UbiE [Bacteroidales bacterium]